MHFNASAFMVLKIYSRRTYMGYWSEVKDVITKGIDLTVDGLKEGAGKAIEKSKEGISFAQLKKDLFMEQRKIHDLLADLGDRTRDLFREKKDIYVDGKIKELMDKITEVEEKCKKFENDIKDSGFMK